MQPASLGSEMVISTWGPKAELGIEVGNLIFPFLHPSQCFLRHFDICHLKDMEITKKRGKKKSEILSPTVSRFQATFGAS
jgi:hypothetical protein